MLIWKKGSVIAAPSTTLFRRPRHLQPAAAFPSLLSGLWQTFRRLISKRLFPSVALKHTHNNALLNTGFFASTHRQSSLSCNGMQRLGAMKQLRRQRSNMHVASAGGMPGVLFAPPRSVLPGRFSCVPLLREFFPFMALHLKSGAGPCVVSGSCFVPEVFLVS